MLGFEAKGQEKLTVEERCSRLGLSTNKSLGLGSGWGREAPKRAKWWREKEDGSAGAGQGLEGGPGSLIKVTEQEWLPLPEENYPESRS